MKFDVSRAHVHKRTLLLGFIAGLTTIGGAPAAELPVKTKPVQYVKVCTLSGAGFFTFPLRRPARRSAASCAPK
jgi:hypothetical protein